MTPASTKSDAVKADVAFLIIRLTNLKTSRSYERANLFVTLHGFLLSDAVPRVCGAVRVCVCAVGLKFYC